jgi:hypothetical protein
MKIEKVHEKIRYTLSNENLKVGDEVYPIAIGRCLDDGGWILHELDFRDFMSGFPNEPHIIKNLNYDNGRQGKPYQVKTDKGYSVKAGGYITVTFQTSVNPKGLFAGRYQYANSAGSMGQVRLVNYADITATIKDVSILKIGSFRPNAVNIIGETSPYITSATASSTAEGVYVRLDGVRLQNAKTVNIVSNPTDVWNIKNATSGKSLTFLTKLSNGNYSVQVVDPKNGESNIFGLKVVSGPTITRISAPAAAENEIYLGERFAIGGKNMIGNGTTTVMLTSVSVGKGFSLKLTQLTDDVIYAITLTSPVKHTNIIICAHQQV